MCSPDVAHWRREQADPQNSLYNWELPFATFALAQTLTFKAKSHTAQPVGTDFLPDQQSRLSGELAKSYIHSQSHFWGAGQFGILVTCPIWYLSSSGFWAAKPSENLTPASLPNAWCAATQNSSCGGPKWPLHLLPVPPLNHFLPICALPAMTQASLHHNSLHSPSNWIFQSMPLL